MKTRKAFTPVLALSLALLAAPALAGTGDGPVNPGGKGGGGGPKPQGGMDAPIVILTSSPAIPRSGARLLRAPEKSSTGATLQSVYEKLLLLIRGF
jgi:hypothetical protein